MSERLRIGVIGAGLIAQCEHIPNLLGLASRFELAGVCDPSQTARDFVAHRFGVPVFPDSDALEGEGLDAVLIAAPDFLHVPETLKALSRGLHVFCEKPLCYAPSEAERVAKARDAAGKVVQIGYMKRHDPAYEACLELLPTDPGTLRYVSVEVHDPDFWPFIDKDRYRFGQDVPPALIDAGRRAKEAQIDAALGAGSDPDVRAGFANSYCSALVHDVNAVHGILDRMQVPVGEIVGAELFAGGGGGLGTVRLLDGQAVWQMTHLAVPKLADYRERIALYFDDRIVELVFPAPYLNHFPTRLTVRESAGDRLEVREIRPGFGEAFIRELEAFWSAITAGTPVRNSVEQAGRDQTLLCGLAQNVIARRASERGTKRSGEEAARLGRVVA